MHKEEGEKTCGICHDDCTSDVLYYCENEHPFHAFCLWKWGDLNSRNPTCPICKVTFSVEDVDQVLQQKSADVLNRDTSDAKTYYFFVKNATPEEIRLAQVSSSTSSFWSGSEESETFIPIQQSDSSTEESETRIEEEREEVDAEFLDTLIEEIRMICEDDPRDAGRNISIENPPERRTPITRSMTRRESSDSFSHRYSPYSNRMRRKKEENYVCGLCGTMFKTLEIFISHTQARHGVAPIILRSGNITCTECNECIVLRYRNRLLMRTILERIREHYHFSHPSISLSGVLGCIETVTYKF